MARTVFSSMSLVRDFAFSFRSVLVLVLASSVCLHEYSTAFWSLAMNAFMKSVSTVL